MSNNKLFESKGFEIQGVTYRKIIFLFNQTSTNTYHIIYGKSN